MITAAGRTSSAVGSRAADTGPLRGSPSGHDLFRKVVKLVRKEDSQLYGAYFVLASAETEHGTTARALRQMNVDRAALAAAARAEIDLLNAGGTLNGVGLAR